MTHVVTQPCCLDAACIDVCPVDCIWPQLGVQGSDSHGLVFIDPESCIDCGACAAVCPADAIIPSELLPENARRFADLNAAFFKGPSLDQADATVNAEPAEKTRYTEPAPASGRRFKVVVVGAGPAGCYAVEALLGQLGDQVAITVLEQAHVPGGLARYGVAPDHVGTRKMARTMEAILCDPRVEVAFNVEAGVDIAADQLSDFADAVIWATGAAEPRELGLPGCDLAGVEHAIDLARWYNGDPSRGTTPDVVRASQVVIVGNGNVALDIARMLLTDPDALAGTETSTAAVAALRSSAVREVIVLGRRTPDHASHSTSEVLALDAAEGFDILIDTGSAGPVQPQAQSFLGGAISGTARTDPGHNRRLILRYNTEPVEVLGRERVESLVGRSTVDGTTHRIPCQAIVSAIGTDGDGQLPPGWGAERRRASNIDGRVVDQDGRILPGVYVTGWIKRGASGGIGTNKRCARRTVAAVVADLLELPRDDSLQGPAGSLMAVLRLKGVHQFGLTGWKAIDRAERAAGAEHGATRQAIGAGALRIALQEESA